MAYPESVRTDSLIARAHAQSLRLNTPTRHRPPGMPWSNAVMLVLLPMLETACTAARALGATRERLGFPKGPHRSDHFPQLMDACEACLDALEQVKVPKAESAPEPAAPTEPLFATPPAPTQPPVSAEEEVPKAETASLETMTVAKLKALAREQGLTGVSTLRKAELIALLLA